MDGFYLLIYIKGKKIGTIHYKKTFFLPLTQLPILSHATGKNIVHTLHIYIYIILEV